MKKDLFKLLYVLINDASNKNDKKESLMIVISIAIILVVGFFLIQILGKWIEWMIDETIFSDAFPIQPTDCYIIINRKN